MIKFIDNFLEKRRVLKAKNVAKIEYDNILSKFLTDGHLSDEEKTGLNDFLTKNNLTQDEIKDINTKACSLAFNDMSGDQRITEEEKVKLETLMKHFNLSTDDFSFNQRNFNKYYTLSLIENGIFPSPKIEDLNVILKDKEVVHWVCHSKLQKLKKVTQRVNYSGFSGSIKIMKGVRYRTGSMKLQPETKEMLVEEDRGPLWITNQRIGFIGPRKSFSIPYNKIMSFEINGGVISIYKDGKEVPYLIEVDDVDVPAMLISAIING